MRKGSHPGRPAITHERVDRHIMASLVRAIDWFDNSLQNVFASRGFTTLHRTHFAIRRARRTSGCISPALPAQWWIAREASASRKPRRW
jgi:hypothetical protein